MGFFEKQKSAHRFTIAVKAIDARQGIDDINVIFHSSRISFYVSTSDFSVAGQMSKLS